MQSGIRGGWLLCKMRTLLSREEAPLTHNPGANLTPACSTSYFLTILAPNHQSQMNIRTSREMRTAAKVLALVAAGMPERAADVMGQRFKALELSLSDQGWHRGQHVELIPSEGATLIDKDEALMAAKEQATEVRMKQSLFSSTWKLAPRPDPRGEDKGKGKGKSKGKKGKNPGWNAPPKEPDKTPQG